MDLLPRFACSTLNVLIMTVHGIEAAQQFHVAWTGTIRGLVRALAGGTLGVVGRTFLCTVTRLCALAADHPAGLGSRLQVSVLVALETPHGALTTLVWLGVCHFSPKVHHPFGQ